MSSPVVGVSLDGIAKEESRNPMIVSIEEEKVIPGRISSSLGIQFPKAPPLDKNGLISREFVEQHGVSYSEKIADIEEGALFPRRDLTKLEMAKIEQLRILNGQKKVADIERYHALRRLDEQSFGLIGKQSDLDIYKKNVLLPGEEVIVSLEVVGFTGIVGHRTDLKLGHGLIMCTKLGDFHRLHFYINDHESSFQAEESFSKVTDETGETKCAQLSATANHTIAGTFKTSFVEGNLVHVHSEVEEVAKFVTQVAASSKQTPEVKEEVDCCQQCCCCAPAAVVEMFVVPSEEPLSDYWSSSVSSTSDKKAKLEELLVLPWEKKEDGVEVKLPLPGMQQPMPNGVKKQAATTRVMHTLNITMRNSATNMVEEGSAIVGPSTSMAEIVKFTSVLQSVSVRGGVQVNDGSSWTSMGFKEKHTTFGDIASGTMFGHGSAAASLNSMADKFKEFKL